MNLEIHTPECQHPFGKPGIHVIAAQDDLLAALVEGLHVEKRVGQVYENLLEMTKPGQTGNACVAFLGESPSEKLTSAWIVLRLMFSPSREKKANMLGLIIMSDPGFEELAKAWASQSKIALKELPIL